MFMSACLNSLAVTVRSLVALYIVVPNSRRSVCVDADTPARSAMALTLRGIWSETVVSAAIPPELLLCLGNMRRRSVVSAPGIVALQAK